jgi:methyl-accepting chemotaxis protein
MPLCGTIFESIFSKIKKTNMEKFITTSAVMLIVVIPITMILMRLLFKDSVFKQIGTLWVVTVLFSSVNNNARWTFSQYPQSIALPVGLLFVGLGIYLASRYIKRPLNSMVNSIQNLADGKLSSISQKNYSTRNDEIGKLSDSLTKLSLSFEDIFTQIKKSSQNLSAVSSDLQSITGKLSNSSDLQRKLLEETLNSLQEFSTAVAQSVSNTKETQKSLEDSERLITLGNQTTLSSIESIQAVLSKIQIISEIAWKTNILSINASIEAARAGNSGKGFGVVAEEIKNLSQHSNDAADDIADVSNKVLKITEEASEQLNSIIAETRRSTDLIREINVANIQQGEGAKQISNSVSDVRKLLHENLQVSAEIFRLSTDINSHTDKMNELLNKFEVKN